MIKNTFRDIFSTIWSLGKMSVEQKSNLFISFSSTTKTCSSKAPSRNKGYLPLQRPPPQQQ